MKAGKHSLIDMALSTATCACFAIPYVGGAMGGAVAISEFIFDWFDPADAVDPSQLPASTQDILDAVDAIKAFISDSEFDQKRADIGAANDTFVLLWGQMTKTKASAPAWDAFTAHRTTLLDQYFAVTYVTGTQLDGIRIWLEKKKDINAAAGLYALTGSLLCGYHRNGLDWQNRVDLDTYAEKKAAFDDYNDALATYKATGVGVKPVTVPDPGPAWTGKTLTPGNVHAQVLHDTLLPQLIKSATAIHDRWRSGWDYRQAQIDSAQQTFLAQNPNLDPVAQDIQWGQILAAKWPALTTAKNLEGVDDDDITSLNATIDRWQSVLDELAKYFPATSTQGQGH